MLFGSFRAFPLVGQGVGQAVDPHFDPHFDPHHFSVFATKKHRKPKFSMLFGAGGVTRTHDLLITNQLLYRLSYTSAFVQMQMEV